MMLSYALRVTSLIGVSLALLQLTIEIVLWIGAPVLLRVMSSLPVRQRERTLYLVQLAPVVGAILLAGLFFVPQYLASETNFAPEHVGRLCVVLATTLYVWWGTGFVHGIRMIIRTVLLDRACRLVGSPREAQAFGPRILTVSSQTPRVALLGFRRPFILISRSLIDEAGLDPLALQVVLDHERSHATQRDNWKLLSLHCLPRLELRLPGRKTWMQLWQSTAEWAADDDAVGGSRARALMLAETLVTLARTPSTIGPQIACTYLVCRDSELASRVERLLHRTPERTLTQSYKTGLTLCFVLFSVILIRTGFSSVVRYLPEHLLHLG
jgi:hypothetical protein